jgi:hypothetical protein
MADEPREFVIPVQRRWTLWILPTLAILYFLLVVALAVFRVEIRGLPTQTLVLGGVVFFVLVILIELPFFFRRRIKTEEPEPVRESSWQDEAGEPGAMRDDEKLVTNETQQGMRVLEYSAPAKSRHRGAVYAKTYVPVAKEWVLRIENLAADTHEI